MKSLLTNLILAVIAVAIYILCFFFQASNADYPGITYFIMLFLGNIYSIITAIAVFAIARTNHHIWKSFWLFTSLLLNLVGCYVLIEWFKIGTKEVSYILISMYSILPILIVLQLVFFRNYFKKSIKAK